MSTTAAPAARTSERRIDVSPRVLVRRVWNAVKANKGLVAAIVVVAVLEAFFTKAPFVLIKPLTGALTPTSEAATHVAAAGSFWAAWKAWGQNLLHHGFGEFADGLRQWLGITFSGSDDQVHRKSVILACSVLAAAAALVGSAAIYATLVLTRYFATKIVVDLRNEVAAHMLKLPLRFFGVRRMGDLISNITNDTAVLSRAFTLACDNVVMDPLLILANVAVLLVVLPEAFLVLLLIVPLMFVPMLRMGRKVRRRSSKSLEAMGDATESMNQMLTGIRTVKAFQLESERLREFEESNAVYLHRTYRMVKAKGRAQATVFIGYQLGFATLIFLLGWWIIVGPLSIEDLTVALMPLSTTYTHVKRLSRAYDTLMESVGALGGIEALLQETQDANAARGGRVVDEVVGAVEFRDVSFAYGSEPVLQHVSFAVAPGGTVALVGPSGAGKSTTLDLLARFHDPTSGQILIDGSDLCELNLPSYRRHIAMVSQQPFLFNTTIFENIRCGRPGASEAEVIEAAKAAQIHEFILTLPQGYRTSVGERGSTLSGGQQQRITIARAIVRNPSILFLDEATSSLDSASEEAVQKALTNLMRGRTSLVIAHRLSTVRNADLILVLDRGRLVDRGTHEELVVRSGLYQRLSQLQQLV